jgi:hypothetical protein
LLLLVRHFKELVQSEQKIEPFWNLGALASWTYSQGENDRTNGNMRGKDQRRQKLRNWQNTSHSFIKELEGKLQMATK